MQMAVTAVAVAGLLAVVFPGSVLRGQEAPIAGTTYIGTELGAPEYEFGYITTIAFVGLEAIAVADGISKNVRLFSLAGRHLHTLGRSGHGPGEFVHPGTILTDSLIRVFDPMQHRIVVFDPASGGHVTTTALRVAPGANVTTMLPLRAGQFIAETTPAWSWGQPGHQTDVAVLHLVGDRVDTIAQFHQGLTVWYTPDAHAPWGIVPSRFGSGGAWAMHDTTVALVDGYAGLVRFMAARADGSLLPVSEIRLPGESRPVTAQDTQREVEDSAQADARRARGGRSGRIGLEPPARWSIGHAAIFAERDRLWVLQEITRDSRERWTVLNQNGVVDSWAFPRGVKIKAVAPPHVAGIEFMDSGVQRVVVYRLESQ
jgi:hypothetical protein